jgi:hypothetical protein
VKGGPRQGDFTNNFSLTLTCPQNIYTSKCFTLTLILLQCIYIFFTLHKASVNICQMHLHRIYSYWHLHTQTLVKIIGFGFDYTRLRSVSTWTKLIIISFLNHFFFILRLLSFSWSTMILSYE